MSRYKLENPEEDSVQLENRYKVTVELYLSAEDTDDAHHLVSDFIQTAKIHLADYNEEDPIDDFEIIDTEPAEVF